MFAMDSTTVFICKYCDQNGFSKEALKEHQKSHFDIKKRVGLCFMCEEFFGSVRQVKKHIKTHLKERPWKCKYCTKAFRYRSLLTRHKRTHTGEKPFACRVCGRPFSQKLNMRVHMRTHTRKPFGCPQCERKFTSCRCGKLQGRRQSGGVSEQVVVDHQAVIESIIRSTVETYQQSENQTRERRNLGTFEAPPRTEILPPETQISCDGIAKEPEQRGNAEELLPLVSFVSGHETKEETKYEDHSFHESIDIKEEWCESIKVKEEPLATLPDKEILSASSSTRMLTAESQERQQRESRPHGFPKLIRHRWQMPNNGLPLTYFILPGSPKVYMDTNEGNFKDIWRRALPAIRIPINGKEVHTLVDIGLYSSIAPHNAFQSCWKMDNYRRLDIRWMADYPQHSEGSFYVPVSMERRQGGCTHRRINFSYHSSLNLCCPVIGGNFLRHYNVVYLPTYNILLLVDKLTESIYEFKVSAWVEVAEIARRTFNGFIQVGSRTFINKMYTCDQRSDGKPIPCIDGPFVERAPPAVIQNGDIRWFPSCTAEARASWWGIPAEYRNLYQSELINKFLQHTDQYNEVNKQ